MPDPAPISTTGIGLTRTEIQAPPTWSAVLDLLLDAVANSNSSVARSELRRMAELADRYVELRGTIDRIAHSTTQKAP